MAPEHEIIMRNGSKKRADEVQIGESIMPFYRIYKRNGKSKMEYEQVYNPNSGKYEFTHRLIGSEVNKTNEKENTLHHINFNRNDNTPTNLKWMTWDEHIKYHSSINSTDRIKDIRRKQGLKLGYRKDFEEYNNSELHKIHDEIRRFSSTNMWKDVEKSLTIKKHMTVLFDDYVWNMIDNAVLNKIIKTQNDIIDYVNKHLIEYLLTINESKKLQHYKKVTKPLIRARIVERGFENSEDYFTNILKNHKIKNIEIIDGDDVYCMTVVGLNGEEDRHNFALCTWNTDGSVCNNGIFVSNCCDQDVFIPVRDPAAPTPIETLSAAQNLTALDDIKYVQNKVFTALRIPKSFLNFEESAGNGQNLALEDVRFTRTVNRIQQAFLMELTKVAMIHLHLLGFEDDLTNFSLSMNNPSTQAEQLEIDNITKKIGAVQTAVADPGNGIPIMSLSRALKEIMKWSEKDIQDNFEEIRLEKAIANELQMTNQIIKRTGIFDTVDRIYGEPGAQYQENQGGGEGDDGMGGGGAPPMGGGGGDFGGGLDDIGGPEDDGGDLSGAEGDMPIDAAAGGDMNGGDAAPPMEAINNRKPLLVEVRNNTKLKQERPKIYDDSFLINEEFNEMIKSLNQFIDEK